MVGIAFYRGRQGDDWVRRLIRFATGGPYTHCCITWSDGGAVEACGRDKSTPWVKRRAKPEGEGWVTLWLWSSLSDVTTQEKARGLLDRPFNYSRVYLGLACGLMGPLGRWLWRNLAPRVWPADALDCVQLVEAVAEGIPHADSPNELFWLLLPRSSIYVRTA